MASPPPSQMCFRQKNIRTYFCLTQTIFVSHRMHSKRRDVIPWRLPTPRRCVLGRRTEEQIYISRRFFTSHADDAEIAETLALIFLVSHGIHGMHRIYSLRSPPSNLVFIRTRTEGRASQSHELPCENQTGWHSCYSDAMSKYISRMVIRVIREIRVL